MSQPTKVVIRNLPPAIAEDEFKASIEQLCQDSLEWFSFHAGKARCAKLKPFVCMPAALYVKPMVCRWVCSLEDWASNRRTGEGFDTKVAVEGILLFTCQNAAAAHMHAPGPRAPEGAWVLHVPRTRLCVQLHLIAPAEFLLP